MSDAKVLRIHERLEDAERKADEAYDATRRIEKDLAEIRGDVKTLLLAHTAEVAIEADSRRKNEQTVRYMGVLTPIFSILITLALWALKKFILS